jgi:hypothetical protein
MRSLHKLWLFMALIVITGRKRKVRVLGNWLQKSMIRHFHWVTQQEVSESHRMALWRGAVQHHLTDSDWVAKERESEESRGQLQAFVTAGEPLVEKF